MKKLFFMLMIIAVVIWAGCGDEENITNNYLESDLGSIIGRVVPAEEGIEVAAWQAIEIKKSYTDDAGYFAITDIEPGLYEIRITTPGGRHRTIIDIKVSSGQTTSLDAVGIDAVPGPLVSFSPCEGCVPKSTYGLYISFTSHVEVDMNSLSSAVEIQPATDGQWIIEQIYGPDIYKFIPANPLRTNTEYQVAIGPNLRFQNGEDWGDSLSFSFTTDEMCMRNVVWNQYSAPNSILSTFTGNLVKFYFSGCLNESSIQNAVDIDPSISHTIIFDPETDNFDLYVDGGLTSGVDYAITLDTTLVDIYGIPIESSVISHFSTLPFEATEKYYPSGFYNIPPRLDNNLVSYRYRVPIDTTSAYSAITIDPPVPFDIRVNAGYSDYSLYVSPTGQLKPATEYTMIIGESLAAVDGAVTGEGDTLSFMVQSLTITQYGIRSGYSSLDTIVDPGTSFGCNIYLNADINIDSFNIATSIDPPMNGFWYKGYSGYSSPYTEYMQFFSTSPNLLEPNDTITISINGSIGLADEIGLGEDVVLRLYTEPVRITSMLPSQGSQNVSYYSSVQIDFNAPMDTVLTEAAFSITTWDGDPVPGTFYWYNNYREFNFNPTGYFIRGETYKAYLDTTARSTTGHRLESPGYTFFRVSN